MHEETMIFIPEEIFDLSQVKSIAIKGRGGKESSIGAILPNGHRVSKSLFDYVVEDSGGVEYQIEIKKQTNDQWFDSGKYYNLSDADKQIILLFINHIQGKIVTISAIRLGDLLDILLKDSRFKDYGWTEYALKTAYELKRECPQLQFKAKLKVRDILRSHREHFQLIYEE
jgi:hypothetical protein